MLHWKGRNDGNGSRATLEMLVRLHGLEQQGRSVTLVAFSGARNEGQRVRWQGLPGQGAHEAAQADNIRMAADAGRYDRVLVLVGNLRARKRTVTRGDTTFEPVAMRLAPAAQVTSVLLTYSAGTAWGCSLRPGFAMQPGKPLPDDAMDCTAHPVKASAEVGGPSGIRLLPMAAWGEEWAFDGHLDTGPAVASAPVLP